MADVAVGGSGRAVGAGCGGWDACWGASVAGGCDIVDDGESWRTPEKGGFTELCAFELEETSFINFLRSSRLSVTNEFPVLEGWGWSVLLLVLVWRDEGGNKHRERERGRERERESVLKRVHVHDGERQRDSEKEKSKRKKMFTSIIIITI